MLAGAGLGTTALAVAALGGTTAGAAGPLAGGLPRPQALGPQIAGLHYVGIDAYGFFPDRAQDRVYQDITGSQPLATARVWAPLSLSAGSVIRQISASYQGQPIIEISRRPLYTSAPAQAPAQAYQKTFAASPGGPFASTENLASPVTIEAGFTYTASVWCSPGTSIIGMQIGYLPPVQGFVPFAGANPRVLDTRTSGGKIAANGELTVDMGVPGARSAVLNLAVTETNGAGFLAAFPANIAWPGNASVNFNGAGVSASNLVVCALDSAGQLKLRCGPASTHAIIDRIGFMF